MNHLTLAILQRVFSEYLVVAATQHALTKGLEGEERILNLMEQNLRKGEDEPAWIWEFYELLCKKGSDALLLTILKDRPQLLEQIFLTGQSYHRYGEAKKTIINQLILEDRYQLTLQILQRDPEPLFLRGLSLPAPLPLAILEGKEQIALQLSQEFPGSIKTRGYDGNTALCLAVLNDLKTLAIEFAKKAPETLALGNDLGLTPVHLAVRGDRPKLDLALDLAILCPSAMEQRDWKSENPLHYLVSGLPKYFQSGDARRLATEKLKKFIQINPRSLFQTNEKGCPPFLQLWQKQKSFFIKKIFNSLWAQEKDSQGVWFEELPGWLARFLRLLKKDIQTWNNFLTLDGLKLMEVIVTHSSANARHDLREILEGKRFVDLPGVGDLLGLITDLNPKNARNAVKGLR